MYETQKNMSQDNYKPNFFYHSYTKSSQDGFICWLIDWMTCNGKPEYVQIKECAREFLEVLLSKHNKKIPLGRVSIDFFQQVKCIGIRRRSIDILICIGKHVLLIEDKIHGEDDSNKLRDYIKSVIEGNTVVGKVAAENLLPIYIKTGNQSLYDQMRIQHVSMLGSKPYRVFDRMDFIRALEYCNSPNSTLNDFKEYLQNYLERITNSFKEWKQNSQWETLSIEGFFRELENHLVAFDRDNSKVGFGNDGDDAFTPVQDSWKNDWTEYAPWGWGWVNDPKGSFAGFWWYKRKIIKDDGTEVWPYLQLEINPHSPADRKLCFKIQTGERDRNIAQNYRECILKSGGDFVQEPDRMGKGNKMTIAQWNDNHSPWLVLSPFGGPLIPTTVKNLIKAQSILDNVKDSI